MKAFFREQNVQTQSFRFFLDGNGISQLYSNVLMYECAWQEFSGWLYLAVVRQVAPPWIW